MSHKVWFRGLGLNYFTEFVFELVKTTVNFLDGIYTLSKLQTQKTDPKNSSPISVYLTQYSTSNNDKSAKKIENQVGVELYANICSQPRLTHTKGRCDYIKLIHFNWSCKSPKKVLQHTNHISKSPPDQSWTKPNWTYPLYMMDSLNHMTLLVNIGVVF